MGCFVGCFGGAKEAKLRKRRYKVIHKDQRQGVQNPLQSTTSTGQESADIEKAPINLVPALKSEAEKRLSPSPRKRVTFDSKVTTYEPVSVLESTDSFPDNHKVDEKEKKKNIVTSREDNSNSGDDSVTSSVASYPPHHRYLNCRESDDESEEFVDSDLDDEDDEDLSDWDENDDDGAIVDQEEELWCESVITASMESRTKNSLMRMNSEEVNSPFKDPGLAGQEAKPIGAKGYGRDRSVHIHPVLNPVENLAQWKALKSKGTLPHKPQKENYREDLEAPRFSFGTEPAFKPKSTGSKTSNQGLAVDASLSNWLVSGETTPAKKTSCSRLETITSERSVSQGSNSVISLEDRPILGALAVEELKQMPATSSPRRSPNRSPDDMPIIGSVGTFWNHRSSGKDSGLASFV